MLGYVLLTLTRQLVGVAQLNTEIQRSTSSLFPVLHLTVAKADLSASGFRGLTTMFLKLLGRKLCKLPTPFTSSAIVTVATSLMIDLLLLLMLSDLPARLMADNPLRHNAG